MTAGGSSSCESHGRARPGTGTIAPKDTPTRLSRKSLGHVDGVVRPGLIPVPPDSGIHAQLPSSPARGGGRGRDRRTSAAPRHPRHPPPRLSLLGAAAAAAPAGPPPPRVPRAPPAGSADPASAVTVTFDRPVAG